MFTAGVNGKFATVSAFLTIGRSLKFQKSLVTAEVWNTRMTKHEITYHGKSIFITSKHRQTTDKTLVMEHEYLILYFSTYCVKQSSDSIEKALSSHPSLSSVILMRTMKRGLNILILLMVSVFRR